MKLIGIDGCPGGWVCATAPADLARLTFTIERDLTAVFSGAVGDGDLVVIDTPIGFASREPRGCDLAARKLFQGPRKSRVFPAPCQTTTAATTYQEACELNRRACGKGIERLLRLHLLARGTGHLARFIVFGSFVTAKPAPNDIDVFILMKDSFDANQVSGEAAIMFSNASAQAYFGASVFWLRRSALLGGEDDTVEYWQTKRDGSRRGIIEVIADDQLGS